MHSPTRFLLSAGDLKTGPHVCKASGLIYRAISPVPALLLLHTFIIKILILKAAAYLKITMNNAFLMTILYSRNNLK